MLVIVSVSRLHGNTVTVHVARPQHNSNASHQYKSEGELREVLSDFEISERAIKPVLNLLVQTDANQELKFPPMDIPQDTLMSRGFRL
jgi:hypothetical protein